ncbi:hypothetical protein DV738_g1384, partial [Chaetothyriales sp. CBS 135597]
MLSTVFSYIGLGKTQGVDIPPVQVHDVETSTDKRDRRLKHLLKLNHANFAILFNHLRFHNHIPHILGSAYILGGSADHLTAVYEDTANGDHLEPWTDSPGEIALHDYREYLGKRDYQRAWVDFFEDQLVGQGYSWLDVVQKFIFEAGPEHTANHWPIFTCLTAGLGHPLIHLGYAFELNSREVAMEALGLAATNYDPKLAALLLSTPSIPSPPATADLFTVFSRVASDSRLNRLFTGPGGDNLSDILASPELSSIIISHLFSWSLPNPTSQFAQSQRLAALLLTSTSPSLGGHGYDFFLVHILTTSHAIRILLPSLPQQHHITLVREWALIALLVYVAQGTPKLDASWHSDYDLTNRDWSYVNEKALKSQHATNSHFVKACRALQVSASTWGDEDQWFLKSAVRFASEFSHWGGFGVEDVK